MNRIIRHILQWEVGLLPSEKNLQGRDLYESVRKRGYHVIPGDNGGPTCCGVTIATLRSWRRINSKPAPSLDELKNLSYDEWLAIMRHLFIDPCRADEIRNRSIALMLIDWRWVNGTQAIRDAQNVLSCVQDGIVGPRTLAALNTEPAMSVFIRLHAARCRAYERIVQRNPSQRKFLQGWLNRTNSIKFIP